MKDFKKLRIWQQGMDIVDKVYDLVPELPGEEKYGMRAQISRSAVSIPANIAEGSSRRSEKEYFRFVEISLGSAFELETHSLVIQRRKWIDEERIGSLLDMIKAEQRMLVKFIEKL
jgi:four helix bundle protein